jgi:nucleoside-diphosphate-sugar epimerase
MDLKFFIPGGAGYIGSLLVETLLAHGHKVSVVDNFYYGQNSLLHLLRNKNLELISGDIRDTDLVKKCVASADVIIPLAALVGAPLCDREPELARAVNFEAPKALFKMISNDQILLMPTTNSAYGSGNAENFCDENSELRPITTYATMKVELEKFLLEKNNAISFRLATVFGVSPRMRLDLLVNDFTYRALKYKNISLFEGHYKRNYIHIMDVVRVFVHSLEKFQSMRGQVYNVGLSTANISKLELCELIKKQIPDFEYVENKEGKDPDQRNYIVSNEKVEATGFATQFTLTDGIAEVIRAYPLLNGSQMKNV